MLDDPTNAVIAESTVDLGRRLGLHVVAEGVETQEAWDRLLGMGCHIAQGYFLTRPLPAEQITGWINRHNARRSAEPRRNGLPLQLISGATA
jgi:EAL domain-containing protein (putative c-di-GMP-specific phosphodiesterase class I)